jgi:hypothetical protein
MDEGAAKILCVANHSAASRLFGDRISAQGPRHAVAPRRAQNALCGPIPGVFLTRTLRVNLDPLSLVYYLGTKFRI